MLINQKNEITCYRVNFAVPTVQILGFHSRADKALNHEGESDINCRWHA